MTPLIGLGIFPCQAKCQEPDSYMQTACYSIYLWLSLICERVSNVCTANLFQTKDAFTRVRIKNSVRSPYCQGNHFDRFAIGNRTKGDRCDGILSID